MQVFHQEESLAVRMMSTLLKHFTIFWTLATHGNWLESTRRSEVSIMNGCMCKPEASNAEQSEEVAMSSRMAFYIFFSIIDTSLCKCNGYI